MALHPQVKGFLENLAAANVPAFHQMTPELCRATFRQLVTSLPPGPAKIASSRDLDIPGPAGPLPLRIYTPAGPGPFPVLMYFHGGGFVIGDRDTYDATCRELCAGSGSVVVSVDYRLAPEQPFPAAPDDCLAATRWVAQHAGELGADASRIAVAGDSAGGNLAAVTAQRIRDEGGPALRAQLLIYPTTDHYSSGSKSLTENAEGYLLTKADMLWFLDSYLGPNPDVNDPKAFPIRAKSLAGLPPALVITAEYDPLRDEGEAYGRALKQAGVPVAMSRYDGAIHGFFMFFQMLEQGRAAIDESCRWLKERYV